MSSETEKAIQPLFASSVNRVATSFPQSLEDIMTTSSVKYCKAGQKHSRSFKPCTFDSVYRTLPSATNALNPEYDQWISTNYANVAHHGLSMVMGIAGDLEQDYYKYRVVTTIYCQFKNRRVNTNGFYRMYDESGNVVSATLTAAEESEEEA